ncbi:HK97 gp10 family phage protein [Rugamonas sp. DEMB1]|uniref:HK97 gp10 family phage protein n=1 Tax=Rugamonas sp. DEMB1 TaxID=3039386 RepID=UPI00244962AA|nr:HK97 gp10 family phage protein [Rugamonas sp. DEMB1]WGG48925.1 HK97 gp10 family phage protein [Rugamonas sp. DEMB1]
MTMLHVDLSGLNAMLHEMGDAAEAAARPVAQAASQVLYDEVKRNAQGIRQKSGNLARSIYQVYSQANSGPGHATYHVSWNQRKAPHGGLVEFGHIQRYVSFVGSDGNWYTAIRAGMRGKPKPRRGASQAVKDAYYVTLPAPKQVAAKPFVRSAASKFSAAADAAAAKLIEEIG